MSDPESVHKWAEPQINPKANRRFEPSQEEKALLRKDLEDQLSSTGLPSEKLEIPIARILPPQPVCFIDDMIKLVDAIKKDGIKVPITVKRLPPESPFLYEVVSGFHLFWACHCLGFKQVPYVIKGE